MRPVFAQMAHASQLRTLPYLRMSMTHLGQNMDLFHMEYKQNANRANIKFVYRVYE